MPAALPLLRERYKPSNVKFHRITADDTVQVQLIKMLRRYAARVVIEVAPANSNVMIAAPMPLLGGRIYVDEIDVGSLWPDKTDKKHWLVRLFARQAPHFERVVGRAVFQPGAHTVRIEKSGYDPIEKPFMVGEDTEELCIEEADVKAQNE